MTSLEESLDYSFKDRALLEQALTHSSMRGKKKSEGDYERLEFLGDQILSFVIADMLYQKFSDEQEGDLSRRLAALVCHEMVSDIARQSGLVHYIRADDAVLENSIACDVCEAVIAALYYDGGFDVADRFIKKWWVERLNATLTPPKDARSRLQEWSQQKFMCLPCYTVLKEEGSAHAPIFTVEVKIEDQAIVTQAGSKRMAMQDAAEKFLTRFVDE